MIPELFLPAIQLAAPSWRPILLRGLHDMAIATRQRLQSSKPAGGTKMVAESASSPTYVVWLTVPAPWKLVADGFGPVGCVCNDCRGFKVVIDGKGPLAIRERYFITPTTPTITEPRPAKLPKTAAAILPAGDSVFG